MTDHTPPPRLAKLAGLVVTNVSKLVGIVCGTVEAIGPARLSSILWWLALYLGAEALERLVTNVIAKALGDLKGDTDK